MLAAVGDLETNACSKVDCTASDVCMKNFFIIQSHHDHCAHEDVPETVERVIHIYEESCTQHCLIAPKFDTEQRKCPPVDCEAEMAAADNEGVADVAYQNLVNDAACLEDCSTSNCANSFRLLKTVHDKCPKDTMSWVGEVAYHDYDEICNDYGCNLAEAASNPDDELICDDPASYMLDSSSSSLLLSPTIIAVATIVASFLVV